VADAFPHGPWLIVRIGTHLYGIESRMVQAVVDVCEPVPIPFSRPHLLGVLLFRGSVLPIIEPGLLAGEVPRPDAAERAAYVILSERGGFALSVRGVLGVGQNDARERSPDRDGKSATPVRWIRWRGHDVELLDPSRFLEQDLLNVPKVHRHERLKTQGTEAEESREEPHLVPERNRT
jgi:chemotaxis signal transduction protein